MHKRNFKNIEPGSGLGKIQFGIGKEKVIDIVGEPDKKYKEVFEGMRLVEVWDYDELGLSLKFDGEEVLELSSFSIISSYYKYNGKSIIGRTLESVSEILKEEEFHKIFHEDVPEKKLLYAPKLNLIVWFEYDVATSLSWDTSDVDIYLGSNFTEAQRGHVRKKISAYRRARKESNKKAIQRSKKEKYMPKSFDEENKRIEETLKEIFGNEEEIKSKPYSKSDNTIDEVSNDQSRKKNSPFNIWFNLFLFLFAIIFAAASLMTTNSLLNGLFIVLFILMGASIVYNLVKED